MNKVSQSSEFECEPLEPRVLLSADGLLPVVAADAMMERNLGEGASGDAVVVTMSVEVSTAENTQSIDSIFDVAGQAIEASVSPVEGEENAGTEAAVSAVVVANTVADTSDSLTPASSFESGSQTSQQLVDTLNAANGPPSQDAGWTVLSSVSSPDASAESGSLQSQALSVSEGGGGDAPTVQADLDSAISGGDGALEDGFAALLTALTDLLADDPLFQSYVPGFLTTLQPGDDVVVVSPTLAQALTVSVDVYSGSKLNSGFGTGLTGTNSEDNSYTNSLADRFRFVAYLDSITFLGDITTEYALDAMDIDSDGTVSAVEAIGVLVFGQIEAYTQDSNYSDPQDFADNFGDDFTADFASPSFLSSYYIQITFSATSAIHGDDVNVTLSNFTLTMHQLEQVDLGYLADELKIGLDPGTPPNPGDPTKLVVTKSLHFDSFGFGLSGGASGPVTSDDFYFAAPTGIDVGLDMNGTVNDMEVNVGFLGTKVTDGDGFKLDMHATGVATDPTNPADLGFTSYPIIGGSGTVTAQNDAIFDLDHDVQFSLAIGSQPFSPFREITVTDAETDGFDDIGDLVSLIQTKVNTAFGSGLITVGNSGNKLTFTLVSTTQDVAGIQDELSGKDTGNLGYVFIEANSVSTYIKQDPAAFSSPAFTFLLSLNGAIPKLVSVAGVDATFVDPDNMVAGDEYYEITVDDLISAIQAAVNAAGLGAVAVLDAAANNRIEFWAYGDKQSLEITKTVVFDTVEKITIDELTSYGADIFEFTPDPSALFEVDLELTTLSGIEKPDSTAYTPVGTINASLDPFNQVPGGTLADGYSIQPVLVDTIPETGDPVIKAKYDLTFGGQMDPEMLDFNVLGASEMIGIINNIAIWLERAVATQLFTAFDLPFADASLASILNFGDMVRDAFLINDGDDGVAAPNKSNSDVDDTARLLSWVPTDASLSDYKLIPMFTNAQQFERRLGKIVYLILDETVGGLSGFENDIIDAVMEIVDATYDAGAKELTFNMSTNHSLPPEWTSAPELQPQGLDQGVEAGMDFALDLDPLGQFVTDSKVYLTGEGRFDFKLGVKLGDAAAALDMDSLLLTDLNDGRGVQVNTSLALTSLIDIDPIVGRLSGNAQFNLKLVTGSGSNTYTVRILRNDNTNPLSSDFNLPFTSDNKTFADLLADINEALKQAGATDDGTPTGNLLVQAVDEWSGTGARETGQVVLRPTAAGSAIIAIQLTSSSGNPAYYELGLPSQSAATSFLVAPKPMSGPIPGAQVDFSVTIQRGGVAEAPVAVSVLQTPTGTDPLVDNLSWTDNNSTLSDLVNDINAALKFAGIDDDIVAGRSGNTLVFFAINGSVRGFSISAGAGSAAETVLGLVKTSAEDDLDFIGVDVSNVTNALSTGVVLRARDTISNPFGRLGSSIDFNINGTQVQLAAGETATNATIEDLVRDLNNVLNGIGALKGKIVADYDGLHLVFRAIDPSVGSIALTNLSTDEADQTGFHGTASADSALRIIASSLAPTSYGVSAPTTFNVSVTDPVNGNLAWTSTLSDAVTITNRNPFDLAADINQALNSGFINQYWPGDHSVTANDNPLIAVVQGDRIVIGLKTVKGASALYSFLTDAAKSVTAFSLTAPGDSTLATELGLVPAGAGSQVAAADRADLVIYFSNGNYARISLDSLAVVGDPDDPHPESDFKLDDTKTIQNLINSIAGQNLLNSSGAVIGTVGTKLSIGLRSDGSGLVLTEIGFVAVPGQPDAFRVVAVNGSPAAIQLGILAGDTTQLDVGQYDASQAGHPDGYIQGAQIATLDITDRVFLENPVLDATIHLSTGDDGAKAEGSFGFVGVKLTIGANELLYDANVSVPFITDGNGRVNLNDLFSSLNSVSNLWQKVDLPAVTGGDQTEFTMGVQIWPASDIVDSLFTLSGTPSVTFQINDFNHLEKYDGPDDNLTLDSVRIHATDPNNPGDNLVSVGTTDLGDLLNFQSLKIGNVLDALDTFVAFVENFGSFDFLGHELPLLGFSINDLLDVTGRFAAAIQTVRLNPAGSLQSLAQALRQGFGIPEFASTAERDAYFAARGIPDPTDLIMFGLLNLNGTNDMMRFDLRLPVSVVQSRSLDLSLGDVEFLGGVLPVDLQGGAGLSLLAYLDTRLSFGIDLNNPGNVYIFDDASGVTGAIKAGADNLFFNAAIGPMGVFVRDGSVKVNISFGMNNGGSDNNHYVAIGDVLDLFGDGSGQFSPNFMAEIVATLPVFFPDDSTYLGDIKLDISGANALHLNSPDFTDPDLTDPDILSLPDFSFIDLSQLDPFGSIPLLLDTLDYFLQGLQDVLDGQVFGIELPLLGKQLSSGADFIENVRKNVLDPIRQFVEQAPEKGPELVRVLLDSLLGTGSAGKTFEGQSLKDFLGLANEFPGLGLLKSPVTVEEIDGGDGYLWRFDIGQTYSPSINIGFDLGFPGLGLTMDAGLDVNIGWDLRMGLGLSVADGAFIMMNDHRPGDPNPDLVDTELVVSVDVAIPNGSGIDGRIGFLQLKADDNGTFFHAAFDVDLFNGQNASDDRLSFAELGLIDVDVGLSAQAHVDLALTLQFNEAILPDTISALLPKLRAGFLLEWDTGDITSDTFDFADSLKFLGFYDVKLDMGSFLSDFLGPIVNKIAEITKPLQPVIDVFTARIPLISDLAGHTVTLLDIAGLFGNVDTGMIYAIADIITLVNQIAGVSSNAELLVPLGDFTLFDVDNPVAGFEDFASNLTLPTFNLGGNSDTSDFDFDSFISETGQQVSDFADKLDSTSGDANAKSISQSLVNKTAPGAGSFIFPLFENPTLAFGLLLGRDVSLVEYDLPPFGVDFTYTQEFPIWGPLFARITGSVGLTIDLAFGYDTAGVRKFANGNFSNPLDLLAGFYVNDTDQPGGVGTDVPELVLRGELAAGAEINLGIAKAGVEGGIILTINFDLYDPDHDGKIRIDELVGNFLYEFKYGGGPATAPIAIFDVYGDVALQLRAFIEFLFFSKKFNITPPITLVEFGIHFDREPILATERGDGALVLNIGDNSAARLNGDTRDIGEEIFVKSVSSSEVLVWGPKFNVDESAAQSYHIGEKKLIIVYGGDGNDIIHLEGLKAEDGITYQVDAGAGDDQVFGGQAGGTMDGGLGDDTLTGGDGSDLIVGGLGNDKIHGGKGVDWLFGDTGSITEFEDDGTPMMRFRALASKDDGDDEIHGDDGNDIVFGGGGFDLLFGGADDDLIIGDGGYFEGPTSTDGIPRSNGFVDILGIVSRGVGADDRIYGGSGLDTILGGPGNDLLDGGSDADVVLGGLGNDLVFGGQDADWLLGEDGDDVIFGYRDPFNPGDFGLDPEDPANVITSDNDGGDYIEGGEGNDFIRGQGGADTIHGNRGADIIFGDEGDDVIGAGDLDRPWFPGSVDQPFDVEAGGDIVFGGADDDTINSGTGGDIVFGDDGLVVYLFFTDLTGLLDFNQLGSRIRKDAGNNHKLIGDGDETVLIKPADLTRNDGYDAGSMTQSKNTTPDLYATEPLSTDGDDYIAGGDGDDVVFGGGGDDEVYGDFNPASPPFGPRPFGQDALLGDGGRVELYGRRYQAIEAIGNKLYDGMDIMSGNDGNDFIFGGGNKDTIYGFENPAQGSNTPLDSITDNDSIFGDNGRMEFDASDRFNRITRMFTTFAGVNESGMSDVVFGQFGSDVIFGGLNSSSDILNGGLGDDIVIGDQGEILFYAPGLGDGWELFAGDDFPTYDPNFPGHEFWKESFPLFLVRSYPDNIGGIDIVSGNEGADIVIGGTAGDFIYGDDQTGSHGAADGDDIGLGDNGEVWFDIDFVAPEFNGPDPVPPPNTSIGRLTARVAAMPYASAIDRIRTSDTAENTGGADTMAGSAGADVLFGGVNNGGADLIYGDRQTPTAPSLALDSADILVGDDGVVDFAYDGDSDRTTLDLIRSYQDGFGGIDIISGDAGGDVAIGGTGGDVIYGDRATPDAASLAADGNDTLLGDNADIFLVAAPDPLPPAGGDLKLVLGAAVYLIRTTDTVSPNTTGGVDTIAGNAKGDVVAGGVFGDYLYGDGVQVVFVAPNFADPVLGNWTISSRVAVKSGADGADIVLGDNGALEWLSTGRLNEISGITIADENPALWSHFQGGADTNLDTLDLITTEQKLSGGRDWIWGGDGNDFLAGGTDSDTIFGDNGISTVGGIASGTADSSGAGDGADLIFGDHGRLYPQYSAMWNGSGDWRASLHSRNFFAIDTGAADGGEGDRMWGQAGADNMLGQQGDDRMWGGDGSDDMIGGHNVRGGWDELGVPGVIDVAITGVLFNDTMDGDGGEDVMAGDNAIIWRRGDTNDPRFRSLTDTSIYTTTNSTITTNVDGQVQPNPTGAAGRDITIIDHDFTIEGDAQGRYGRDIMAGGASEDRMFGELGDDLMQGDGSIDLVATAAFYLKWPVNAPGLAPDLNPGAPEVNDSYVDLFFNIPEQLTDGGDYMEGNGGADLMFGGLGQDDMIGGSSELYGLPTYFQRPDGSDIMFGGAGIRSGRNDIGASIDGIAFATYNSDQSINVLAGGHAADADYMMGDNADIYRLVNAQTHAFLTFNYDNYAGGVRIVPRAMQQLDYHLGGADYNGGVYESGAAHVTSQPLDNGAADYMDGEAGDDIMFGMTGSDVMFGGAQDDDMIGGYGNDWMSGGTGQDGMIGDDGLIYTSRNSTQGEPLYNVVGLLASDSSTKYSNGNALDETISTPGDIQIAIINPAGALKKAADLVPFSYDANWLAMDDEFPDDATNTPFADDILFGGLDSDWLHGGSGDDGISGAEALEAAYIPTFDINGNLTGILNLGFDAVGLPDGPWVFLGISTYGTTNPGDAMAFNPVDTDGQHLNNRFRAGEFFLYDEYDPRRKIMLDSSGNLWKSIAQGTAYEYVLNFRETEGIIRPAGTVPKATGQQTDSYPQVNDDGKDAIFGDNGNDWLVGGTGRDDIYGGWGNDMLNADDKHSITDDSTKQNTVSDTAPTYEDRAYGGAGRDILIGNTGGDRLIDWVGEYNSYLVPFAPFGEATVSRTLQPFLPEFLYALSAGDGADFTRYTDAIGAVVPQPTNNNPNPSRNGEPYGELGLVLQKDFAWQDQTGAPADPQAGNIPGGKRDVLRTASFNDGYSDGFFADSGTWTVKSGVLTVAPAVKNSDAVSVFYVDDFVPSYFEVLATLNPVKPTGGYKANAYIVFDYQGEGDFKFAGVDVSTNKLVIGHRESWGWAIDAQASVQGSLKPGTNYNIFISINGSAVTAILDNKTTVSFTFAPRIDALGISHGIHDGMVGLGADNAKATIDNMVVQRIAPEIKYTKLVDFSSGLGGVLATPLSGTWSQAAGRYAGTAPGGGFALDLMTLYPAPSSYVEFSSVLSVTGAGGLVFDAYGPNTFKFVTIDKVAGTVTLGHKTAKGLFVDAVYTNASVKTSADQGLAVTLKGTTVSVKWNNQLVISFVYNALVTDGATGLLSRSGTTSFNEIKFQTDDATMPQAGATTTSTLAQASMFVTQVEVVTSLPVAPAPVVPSSAVSPVTTIQANLPGGAILGTAVNSILDGNHRSSMTSNDLKGTHKLTASEPGELTALITVDGKVSVSGQAKRVIGGELKPTELASEEAASHATTDAHGSNEHEAKDDSCCGDEGICDVPVDEPAQAGHPGATASAQAVEPHSTGDTDPKGPNSKDDSSEAPASEE